MLFGATPLFCLCGCDHGKWTRSSSGEGDAHRYSVPAPFRQAETALSPFQDHHLMRPACDRCTHAPVRDPKIEPILGLREGLLPPQAVLPTVAEPQLILPYGRLVLGVRLGCDKVRRCWSPNHPNHTPRLALETPLCDIPSGCCSFTGPWTVTRSSLRMLRWVAAFCRPLRPVLLLVSFPRSRSPVVGVLGLCWMWHGVPFACQRRPVVGVLRMCWLLPGSFDCFCCPHTSVHRPSIACLAVFLCGPPPRPPAMGNRCVCTTVYSEAQEGVQEQKLKRIHCSTQAEQ